MTVVRIFFILDMQMFIKPVLLGMSFSALLIVSLNTVVIDSSFVKLDQNGYENVLVRIADDVQSADCIQTITNLQVYRLKLQNSFE